MAEVNKMIAEKKRQEEEGKAEEEAKKAMETEEKVESNEMEVEKGKIWISFFVHSNMEFAIFNICVNFVNRQKPGGELEETQAY